MLNKLKTTQTELIENKIQLSQLSDDTKKSLNALETAYKESLAKAKMDYEKALEEANAKARLNETQKEAIIKCEEATALCKTCKDLQQANAGLRTKLTDANELYEKAKQLCETRDREITELNAKVTDLEAQLATEKTASTDKEATIKRLQTQVLQLTKDILVLKANADLIKKQIKPAPASIPYIPPPTIKVNRTRAQELITLSQLGEKPPITMKGGALYNIDIDEDDINLFTNEEMTQFENNVKELKKK